ncbi:MAG: site-specific DNA-methyltransferase [Caldilineaceae bacterium]|nr:site-specific DNA-methyltransferase [Caldilineaceae bacterium]MCY3989724.1 site-specific DNA-methyltransferase [Caldilineaceae bacterium]
MTRSQQTTLFPTDDVRSVSRAKKGTTTERLKRIDTDVKLREQLLSFCRLKHGDIWEDSISGHRVGVLDAAKHVDVDQIMNGEKAGLFINDPPYNVMVGNANTANLSKIDLASYLDFSQNWVANALQFAKPNAHLYVWIGADYKDNFQPLPDFMVLMREFRDLSPRNLITVRNQRGYGTQKNWMWVRQELLHYVKGNPDFNVTYTDIPRILRGYYKEVDGRRTENRERSKSETIRPGNVWVDVQQVFYRMEENVPGCYAQKPLKAIQRIIQSCSQENDLAVDFFAHSGTTLIAGELSRRRVYTFDIDPIFAEIAIRRLEHFRKTGRTGWQWHSPFPEIDAKEATS